MDHFQPRAIEPAAKIFFRKYNQGLSGSPANADTVRFFLFRTDFRQFDRDLRCTPAGDEDVRPGGIKNVRFLPDMPEIPLSICQGSLSNQFDRSSQVVSERSAVLGVLQLSINGPPTARISTQRQLQLQPIWYLLRFKSNFIV